MKTFLIGTDLAHILPGDGVASQPWHSPTPHETGCIGIAYKPHCLSEGEAQMSRVTRDTDMTTAPFEPITKKRAAEILQISIRTLDWWVEQGMLPAPVLSFPKTRGH